MSKSPKNSVGWLARKAVALVVAYAFFATSVWSVALPGEVLAGRSSGDFMSSRALTQSLANNLASPLSDLHGPVSTHANSSPLLAAPNAVTNLASKVPMAMMQAGGGTASSISFNFNATAIPAGDTIWFSAVLKLNGSVPDHPVSIAVHNSTIQFTAGSTSYSLDVPASVVTFSPTTTTSTASFNTANNSQPVWLQNQLNPQPSGNTLLQAFAFPVPAGGLPGGIKNVTWTNDFSSDTSNIALNWQWAAAVYTSCVNTTYNSDDVKPADDSSASIYKNSDHAGTPEACKSDVTQGATGGGASNFTGSLSGTASVTPPVVAAAPVITGSINPVPNANGWNNMNVTVSFTCSDANFAIVTCPAPVMVGSEGANQVISGTAVDQVGGKTANTSVTVNIDKSSPSITATPASSGGSGSVLTMPVTINFTCTDAVSGVASCPSPIQVTTAGVNQVFSGTATDKAGNSASTSISVTTENAPLAITPSIAPPPLNGWNNTNVTVSYQCMGGVPPVSCPQATTVSAEGAGQIISATATDAASQSVTVSTTINIDKTPPTLTATIAPAPNAAGWNTSDVTITYACSDTPSGVAFCPSSQVVSGEGKAQQITATDIDIAGNSTTTSTTINLEKTAPNITASVAPTPNAAGWNNANVTVSFTCTPSVSDIVNCPTPVSVTTEAAGQQISGTVTDQAGKSNTATVTVNLDKTPPSIGIAAPVSAGYINNNLLPITIVYSDAGSGIDPTTFHITIDGLDQTAAFTATATGASGSPAAAFTDGVHTITVSISDVAGNPATATSTFTVDTVPPQVTITQPANGFFTNAASLVVSGTVTAAAPVTVTVQGTPAPLQGNTFTTTVPTQGSDGGQTITIVATDAAGNSTPVTLTVNIDRTPPTIAGLIAPAPNGNGWNNTPVTVSFTCADNGSGVAVCPAPVQVSTEGANQAVSGTATDKAGNSGQATVTVNIDETAPTIAGTPAPPPNAAGWNNTNVVISYVCSDSLSGIAICPPPATVSTEGAAQQISAQATDQAGNRSSVTTTLNIDKTPPVVTASAAPPANAAGWNNTNVTVSFSCTDNLSGVATCPSQTVVTTEGQNQNISGQATDVAGNTATGSISLSIDKTPPTIVQLSTPDHISRLHGGQVSVTVNDNFTVTQVTISVNGNTLGTLTAAPYQADLEVPSGANPGDTLTVTAVATDEAGNTQTSSRGVRVAADGVIVGQVLSDATSFPIQNAVVQSLGSTSVSDQTDDRGRYSLQASDPHLFLSVTSAAPPTTAVEREVFVQEGVGTVPVDARLTPLATASAVGSAGGTLTAGNISITVPAGVVGNGTSFQLTPLTGQGLPGLLPLGWSPLAAFDLRATSSAMNLSAAVAQMPNTVSHLVTYNAALHAWTMVTPNLQAVSGTVTVPVPAPGAYALVTTDAVTPAITIPNSGEALTGIDMQLLDDAATSSGSLSPSILPPGGGTATATLGVQTAAPVPSGTVIQANISETFSLTSGDVVSEQSRSEDIVIYNALASANSTLGAQFAVTPSQTFTNSQLLTGKVHLDILAGREGVRGQPGGSNPLTLTDGVSTLSVPGGAVNEDTAISLQSISLEDFVPTTGSQGPIQEVLVDFSGDTLNTAAQLSISATGLNPADTYLLTTVQRIDGVPHMVLAALAQINGGNLTSVASPGLPGVVQGGEYVFYDIPAPMGFVQGTVSSSAGPVQALVKTDSLLIVSITGANGNYIVPALAGSANLNAGAPHTNLIGSTSVQVTAGQTAQANITLSGTVTSATVSPADGTLGVSASTTITITTTEPLNPQSIVQTNLVLLQGTATSGTPVPVQPFVLSSSGTVLSFAPVSNLQPATQYTIQVSGLADTFGGAIVVPTSSFTTKAVAALNFNPNAITFSFPDQNGNIHVSAPAGSLPPGTQILIIDQTNGLVLTLTALNDGSVSGQFIGTLNDTLQVTVTDPTGATTTFTTSQFTAPDGSVSVASGGGTVTGPGGVELRIPSGALNKATVFQISSFGPDLFPDRPDLPGANFGGGLQVTTQTIPTINQELKLAFPKPPDAPDGAFYYAYRRLQGPNGATAFETLDHAFVEGTGSSAKVVTASPPFSGFSNMFSSFSPLTGGFGVDSVSTNDMVLMWTFDALSPGVPLPGVVTGQVRRAVFTPGQPEPTFVGVPGVVVSGVDAQGNALLDKGLATSQADGTFTLFDPDYKGGNVTISATDGKKQYTATAFELTVLDTKTIFQLAGPLFTFYKNVAAANITFDPLPPPQPAPQLTISAAQRNPDGSTTPVNGLILAGTPLVISAKTNNGPNSTLIATVTGGTIQGQPYAVQPDPSDPTNFIFTPDYVVPSTGTFLVTATALPPLGGNPITASYTFLAIGAGGSNSTPLNGQAPDVITGSLVPKPNAKQVPTNTFPQVVFTEPVNNVLSNLTLRDLGPGPQGTDCDYTAGGTLVPIKLSGVAVTFNNGPNNPVISPVDSISDATNVTSITVIPQVGLKFNECYKLSLANGITDLDTDANGNPAPNHLAGTPPNRDFGFETFGPQELSSAGDQPSIRMVVIGDDAYTTQWISVNSQLVQYDVTDPTTPIGPNEVAFISGRAIDVAGEQTSPDTGGGLVGVATGIGILPMPSNIWFYDVSNPLNVQRIGAVSVTSSAGQQGAILRMVMQDSFAYTSTSGTGIQVVDIRQAIANYSAAQQNLLQFGTQITTDGEGFGQSAVVNTIPVKTFKFHETDSSGNPVAANAIVLDLKVGNYVLNNQGNSSGQPLVVATGMENLVVADPQAGNIVAQVSTLNVGGTTGVNMQLGSALALGTLTVPCPSGLAFNVQTCNVAAVVGNGDIGPMLMLVDLTDPTHPVAVSYIQLSEAPTDVVLNGNTALVGFADSVQLVDLTSPTSLQLAGTISGVGGHLTLSDSGLLYSTGLLNSSEFGLHISTFQPLAVLPPVAPLISQQVVISNQQFIQTLVKLQLNPRVVAADPDPSGGILEIFDGAVKIGQQTVQFVKNTATVVFNAGLQFAISSSDVISKVITAKLTVLTNRGPLVTQRNIVVGSIGLLADLNNDTVIDKKDAALKLTEDADPARNGQPDRFAFWEADPNNVGTLDGLLDFATLRLRIGAWPLSNQARVHLHITGTGAQDWIVVNKHGNNFKDYLSDSKVAAAQLADAKVGQVGCEAGAEPDELMFFNLAFGSCFSDSNGEVELPASFGAGDFDLLIACNKCATDLSRKIELKFIFSDQSVVSGDHINLDIRPMPAWATAYSVRSGPGSSVDPNLETPTPFSIATLEPGFSDVTSNDIYSPSTAFVLVHGYNVSEDSALHGFGPAFIKRFYWTATPILPPQNVKPIIFVWPGDLGPFPPGARFPLDEFRALESGVGLANFIANKVRGNFSTTQVLAHSLGNLVVHSALSTDIIQPNDINLYLMYDAAVPAEALVTPNEPAALQQNLQYLDSGPNLLGYGILNSTFRANRTNFLAQHAVQLGWIPSPDPTTGQLTFKDNPAIWQKEFDTFINPDKVSCEATDTFGDFLSNSINLDTGDPAPILYSCLTNTGTVKGWSTRVANTELIAAPQYGVRWSQVRSNIWAPDAGNDPTPHRGPWTGLFQGNLNKTRIVNSFNAGDCVLNYVYYLNSYTKPYRSLSTALPQVNYMDSHQNSNPFPEDITVSVENDFGQDHRGDNHDRQFWADLNVDYNHEAFIIFAGNGGASQRNMNIIRQWAEVGLWFPTLSGPLGSATQALGGTTVTADPNNPGDINSPGSWSNIDLTFVGNLQRDGETCTKDYEALPSPTAPALSHSFMPSKPFSEVWKGFKLYRKLLTGDNPTDPDPQQP